MQYSPGVNAFAVWTGTEWILKPVCSGIATGVNAVGIRAADSWVVAPTGGGKAGENAVTIPDSKNDPVLWPIGCPEEDSGGCTGSDPLCSSCPCEDNLSSTYTVTLSGIPAICAAHAFNGTWTLTWITDCQWAYDISATQRIELIISGNWSLAWSDNSAGGPAGSFSASGGTGCAPEMAVWSPYGCTEPLFCWNLCSQYMANATCVITNP